MSAFEPAYVRQQLVHGALDLGALMGTVLAAASGACAEARDAEVAALRSEVVACGRLPLATEAEARSAVAALRRVRALLDAMRLDLLCYHLEAARPLLAVHGVAYERRAVRRQLDSGRFSLTRTRVWLADAARSRLTGNASSGAADGIGASDVYVDGVVALLSAPAPWTSATAPESWGRDIARLVDLQNSVQQVAVLASIVMIVSTGVPAVRSDPQVRAQSNRVPADDFVLTHAHSLGVAGWLHAACNAASG